MSIGIFTDKNYHPSDTEISETIGSMLPAWNELVKYIRENYNIREEFKFLYGKQYGWALQFQINKKLLTSLYPVKDGFTAQVILSPSAVDKTQNMKLGKNVHGAIDKAYPYPEGRWLFVPIESESDIEDIKSLLVLRSEMLRQGKKKACQKEAE